MGETEDMKTSSDFVTFVRILGFLFALFIFAGFLVLFVMPLIVALGDKWQAWLHLVLK